MILRVASAGPGHRFQAVGQARRQDLGDGKLIYFSSLQLCLAIRNSLLGCGLQPYSEWVRAHPPFSTWICHSSNLKEIGGVCKYNNRIVAIHNMYVQAAHHWRLQSIDSTLFLSHVGDDGIQRLPSASARRGLQQRRRGVERRWQRRHELQLGEGERGTAAAGGMAMPTRSI
uniref:Uncharacterized protein n=1 Tax=Oryza glumipatula TaxID=40148 RepID=A0A0E0AQA2_9ORYZ